MSEMIRTAILLIAGTFVASAVPVDAQATGITGVSAETWHIDVASTELLPCEPLFLRVHRMGPDSQPAGQRDRMPIELRAILTSADGSVRRVRFPMLSLWRRFGLEDPSACETMVSVDFTGADQRPFIFDTPGVFDFCLADGSRSWRPASNRVRITVRQPSQQEAAARRLFENLRVLAYLMERSAEWSTKETLEAVDRLASEYADSAYGKLARATRVLDRSMGAAKQQKTKSPGNRDTIRQELERCASQFPKMHPLRETLLVFNLRITEQGGQSDEALRQLQSLEQEYPDGLSKLIRDQIKRTLTSRASVPLEEGLTTQPRPSDTSEAGAAVLEHFTIDRILCR